MGTTDTAATGLDHLPDAAIGEILARLSTREAVRTSVLSRSWRHHWKSIPDLDLSSAPFAAVDKTIRIHSGPVRHLKLQINTKGFRLVPSTIDPSSFADLVARSSISLRSIDLSSMATYHVSLGTLAVCCPRLTLIRLSGCVIHKLDLDCTTIFSHLRTLDLTFVYFAHDLVDRGSTGYLSRPMYMPPCPKLENLTLDLCGWFRCGLNTIGRDFPLLTHLTLSSCHLDIAPYDALPSLRALHLYNVDVRGKLSVLLSSCPLLEMLSLIKVNIASERLVYVDAPNLQWLEVVEVCNGGYLADNFRITLSPCLETVLIGLGEVCRYDGSDDGADESCNLMKVLGGLPGVKKLALRHETLEFLQRGLIPEKLPTTLDHLTHLSMDVDFSHSGEASAVFCLLGSAPNLQEVEFNSRASRINTIKGAHIDRENFWKAREHMDPFHNLQTVRMTLSRGDEDELKFKLEVTRFVLSKARVLETMMIELIHVTYTELVMKEILGFPKASNQAQIVFPGC